MTMTDNVTRLAALLNWPGISATQARSMAEYLVSHGVGFLVSHESKRQPRCPTCNDTGVVAAAIVPRRGENCDAWEKPRITRQLLEETAQKLRQERASSSGLS
jgi:ribosomal protein L34E